MKLAVPDMFSAASQRKQPNNIITRQPRRRYEPDVFQQPYTQFWIQSPICPKANSSAPEANTVQNNDPNNVHTLKTNLDSAGEATPILLTPAPSRGSQATYTPRIWGPGKTLRFHVAGHWLFPSDLCQLLTAALLWYGFWRYAAYLPLS